MSRWFGRVPRALVAQSINAAMDGHTSFAITHLREMSRDSLHKTWQDLWALDLATAASWRSHPATGLLPALKISDRLVKSGAMKKGFDAIQIHSVLHVESD